MSLAEKVVRNANQMTRSDIEALQAHGFTEEQILDIILTAASRSFFSKVTDAMGFHPDDAWLQKTEELLGENTFRAMMVGRSYAAAKSPR